MLSSVIFHHLTRKHVHIYIPWCSPPSLTTTSPPPKQIQRCYQKVNIQQTMPLLMLLLHITHTRHFATTHEQVFITTRFINNATDTHILFPRSGKDARDNAPWRKKACGWFDMFRLGPGFIHGSIVFWVDASLNVVRSNSRPFTWRLACSVGTRTSFKHRIVQTYLFMDSLTCSRWGSGVIFIEV